MAAYTYGDTVTFYDDGTLTFAAGVTAVDRGDSIELTNPGGGRSVITPEGDVIVGDEGAFIVGGSGNLAAAPFVRQALADQGVPTTRS